MIAYKFLLCGAVGPFSRHPWPTPEAAGRPGPWVRAAGGMAVCRAAVHACRAEHLPWWIQAELWETELTEPVRQVRHKLTAPGGRLVRRLDAWDAAAARDFAVACALRARDHALPAVAGSDAAAGRLAACEDLDAIVRATRAIAPALDDPARVAVTMAGDAALSALDESAVVAGYIAAHTARHVAGPGAMAGERRRQAAWLADRLELGSG